MALPPRYIRLWELLAFSFPGRVNAYYSVVGGHMNRSKTLSLLPVLLLTVLSLAACSGPKNRCTTNCGTGTATVSLTLVADTPPASPSLISYKVTVTQVTV